MILVTLNLSKIAYRHKRRHLCIDIIKETYKSITMPREILHKNIDGRGLGEYSVKKKYTNGELGFLLIFQIFNLK